MSRGRLVCVRQFLLPGREQEFGEVFRLHRQMVSERDGFVSLRRLRHAAVAQAHENEVVVMLEFEDDEKLAAWRASDAHQDIAGRYRALWARDPVVEILAVEE